MAAFLWYPLRQWDPAGQPALTVLPAPEDPHWDGDSGIALWEHVPNAGSGSEASYHYRLYWQETDVIPDLDEAGWVQEGSMKGNISHQGELFYQVNMSNQFQKNGFYYYAVWSNLDDCEDEDSFNVRVYNVAGDVVGNNIWPKEMILSIGYGGIWIAPQLLAEEGGPYRFTVQVYSSRPNEFRSSLMPDPVPEEYFSSWMDIGQN